MESQSGAKSCCPSGGTCGVPANSKVYCKCGEGWSCVITKLEGPSKPFYKCEESSCVCITDEGAAAAATQESKPKQVVETGGAYCVCGEGYACTITKTKGPDAGQVFCECGNGYSCEIDAQTVKLSTA